MVTIVSSDEITYCALARFIPPTEIMALDESIMPILLNDPPLQWKEDSVLR